MNLRYTLALLGAGLPLIAAADEQIPDLSQIIVTATRMAEPAGEALASVTIITREDIDRLQPHSVAELLAGLPGLFIASNGDLGKATYLFVRGTNPDHVLILIDGIKVGSTSTGATAIEQLPVEQIDRIEIVRGPRASLYGSEAIGGVIQIFTRHSEAGAPNAPSLLLSGGSHATYQGQVGDSGSLGNAWYNASVTGLTTHGIPICAAAAPVSANCYSNTPRQGFWNDSAALSGGYKWDALAQLSFTWLRADSDTFYNGNVYAGNKSPEVQQVLGGQLSLTPLSGLTMTFAAGQSKDQSALYFGDTPAGYFDTSRDTYSWINRLDLWAGQRLTIGADYELDLINSDTAYALTSRHDIGLFALYEWIHGGNEIQLSARQDDNQQFGHHETDSVAYGYRFGEALRLLASYGTAFKAPTFNDLYYPFYGDPNLLPETSNSVELGAQGNLGHWNYGLNAYQIQVNDLIEYNPATFGTSNIDRARIRALEGQLGWQGAPWRSQLSLTLMDARDREPGPTDDLLLPNRARVMVRWDVDRSVGRTEVGTTIFAVDRTFSDPANTQPLGGYVTVALRATLHVTSHWLLQAQVQNAFNKDYETVLYYNQPGAEAYLSVRYVPSPP